MPRPQAPAAEVGEVDLRHLARSPLRDAVPYDPGPVARELKQRYGLEKLVKLNWNEDLFGPLPGVREAVVAELERISLYPEEAYSDLRAALSKWAGVPATSIVPAHGIQALIVTMVGMLLEAGDIAVAPTPSYGLYGAACRAAGAQFVAVPCRELRLDVDGLIEAARSSGARVLWVCDPNNPTGSLMTSDEWAALLDGLPDGCAVVADEAYADYVEPSRRLGRERDAVAGRPVIVLRTFSKLLGLAGMRLGYAVLHPSLVPCVDAVQEPFNVNRAALAAGLACLRDPEAVERRRLEVVSARRALCDGLRAIGMRPAPSDANFVLADVGCDDELLVEAVARRGFLLRPGSEFGLPGHVRVTVGPVALMEQVTACMAQARDEQSAASS